MTVEDMFGNMNDPILQEFPGKVASSFIDDDVCPSLRQIDIDMDRGVLTLTFSEPVEAPYNRFPLFKVFHSIL